MSREDVVAIASRLMAVYLLVSLSRGVVDVIQIIGEGMHWAPLQLSVMFLQLLAATVLWFFPLSVARALLPAMSEPRSETHIGPSLALSLGLTLIGAWFVVNALVDAGYWIGIYLHMKANPIDVLSNASLFRVPDTTASIIATVVQLVIGVALVLGAAGLQRLIFRMRYGKDAP